MIDGEYNSIYHSLPTGRSSCEILMHVIIQHVILLGKGTQWICVWSVIVNFRIPSVVVWNRYFWMAMIYHMNISYGHL